MRKKNDDNKSFDLNLMLGGPLYQLYLRLLYKRRIIATILLTWLPLLLLAFMDGFAFRDVKVPFIFDFDIHIRFLVSLGLFIAAEGVARRYTQVIVCQFIERDIISQEVRAKFDMLVTTADKLRNSSVATVVLLIFVYTFGHFIWMKHNTLDIATWYGSMMNGQVKLTMAGYWYVYFSLPVFHFILLRWYYRVFIWGRFLWQVSRLPLRLNSLHPDRAAGMGFLKLCIPAFQLGLLAHTVLLSGLIANRILHAGQTLPEFKLEIVSMLLFLLLLVLTPQVFFIVSLVRAKRKGLIDYGRLACGYVNDFRSKWIEKNANTHNELLLGSSDIQSLADLSNSFNIVNEMRSVPFSSHTLIQLLALTAFPLFPLLLTMIPLNEMIIRAIKIFL